MFCLRVDLFLRGNGRFIVRIVHEQFCFLVNESGISTMYLIGVCQCSFQNKTDDVWQEMMDNCLKLKSNVNNDISL